MVVDLDFPGIGQFGCERSNDRQSREWTFMDRRHSQCHAVIVAVGANSLQQHRSEHRRALLRRILSDSGTFYLNIAMNGLMLGGVFAFTSQHGLAGDLFKFIIAHGCVELSVICIAGAAGMALGASLAVSRRKELGAIHFRRMMLQVGRLIILCALLLVGCGFIEGFVSPDHDFPMVGRIVIGVGYWLIMLTAMTGHLFRRLPV